MANSIPPAGFSRVPTPRSLGNSTRGQQICGGVLALPGIDLKGDPLGQPLPGRAAFDALHGFGWLDDLAALNTPAARSLAKRRTDEWIVAHPEPNDTPVWAPRLTARRAMVWVRNAAILFADDADDRSDILQASLGEHLDLLTRSWPDLEDPTLRLEVLASLAICTAHLEARAGQANKILTQLADEAVSVLVAEEPVGLPDRAPESLLDITTLLIWARDVTETPPAGLQHAIDASTPILRALRHADGMLPRFHGGGRGEAGQLDRILRAAGGPADPAPGLAMGYARMVRNRTTLVLDASAPPQGQAARRAHASTLAFEMTVGRQPLVVSCGSGRNFGRGWARASRATACHSTLCVIGRSSSALLRDEQGKSTDRLGPISGRVWVGDPTEDGEVRPPLTGTAIDPLTAHLAAGHEGWSDLGVTHERELWLEPDGQRLTGEDALTAQTDGRDPLPFAVRFHLHPDVMPEVVDDWVALELPGGELWQFGHDQTATLSLEPTAWLDPAQPQPIASRQIVLTSTLDAAAQRICWTFAKARFT